MKRFLIYVSLQPKKYDPLTYQSDKFEYGETRLPILPVIHASVKDGEKCEVILIGTANENESASYEKNMKYTTDELTNWAKNHNVQMTLTVFNQKETGNMENLLTLFRRLIHAVENNWDKEDVFYADITFGMKSMTLIMLYVLRYIHSVKKNRVNTVVYGQVFRNSDNSTGGMLHDVTALFHMDSIISSVSAIPNLNAEKVIDLSFQTLLEKE